MSKHTPDRWYARIMPGGSIRVDNGDSDTRAKLPHRPGPKIICHVEEIFMNRAERFANACVLAASTDLLAACHDMIEFMGGEYAPELKGESQRRFSEIAGRMDAAITRAEGGAA